MLRRDFKNPAQPLNLFPGRTFDPPKSLCRSLGGVVANVLQLKQKHSACYESVFYSLYVYLPVYQILLPESVMISFSSLSPHCVV